MSDAALVIGVNKTGGLPPLNGAVAGAEDFADWATAQGLAVTLVTDKGDGEVTVSELQDAVDAILAPRNCKKLVVYFSGHGFLISPNAELWLLSKAPARSQEAVDVLRSVDHARYAGIEHVIFVSDACRSGGPTHQHRSVSGSAIFPPPASYEYNGKIDRYFATRPGDVALEFRDEKEAVNNFKGIFTECMLRALNGKEPNVVTRIQDNGRDRWLVLADKLDPHLETVVPVEASNISIKLSQKPVAISESRVPQFFSELVNPPQTVRSGASGPGSLPRQPGLTRIVAAVQPGTLDLSGSAADLRGAVTSDEENDFAEQVDRLAAARGRDHFETETGFTVYGNVTNLAVAGDWTAELFQESDLWHVRVSGAADRNVGSILIEFEEGFGTVLAIKRGLIGTVVEEDGLVVSVNYTPSAQTSVYHEEYAPMAERIEQRRAFAATAMRHGLFSLDDEEEAGDAARYLRMMKQLDPTLGIYAAYAYQQAGRLKSIRSVAQYMEYDGLVPFDVLLLARRGDAWPDHAPFCPMLRQGWAMLDLHPPSLDRLAALRAHLLPSLWTAFTAEGVKLIRTGLASGEFS